MAKAKPKELAPIAQVRLVGDVVEPAAVITPLATEWPKVGCKVLVRHNADQATVFNIVSIGPVAEQMLQAKVGNRVQIHGQIKAATGQLEVFASAFKPGVKEVVVVSGFGRFFGEPPTEGDEWKE
jgi:hypothetical protein